MKERLPQILRSRVAPWAALYGVLFGTSINWSDASPVAQKVTDVLLIGAFTVIPAVFGYLIVREAREPSILYGVFAPVYAVMLAVASLMLTVTGEVMQSAGIAALILLGIPLPSLVAIVGGLYAGGSASAPAAPRIRNEKIAQMKRVYRRALLALWLAIPVFLIVFLVVRALWLAYLRTLTLAELHMHIFEHSTAVALGVWTVCLVLTAVIVWALTSLLTRPSVRDDSPAI